MSRSLRRLTPSNFQICQICYRRDPKRFKSWSYGGIWYFHAGGGWHGWLAYLLEILYPPPIFERLRENDAEYPKFQTHWVIGLYSNLVEKLSSKNELSIPAEFLYRLWWYYWDAIQSSALNRNIQGRRRRNKYIEAIGASICSSYKKYKYCKRKAILWILFQNIAKSTMDPEFLVSHQSLKWLFGG